ncbi:MAG: NADH-quinone oxidoreductase subunit A [Verrucomicrobia bacterium]|nr:NADH-quinone oxidoreductase subunit A [Verrucomicrobiota bacterium]
MNDSQSTQYVPVLMLLLLAIGFTLSMLVGSALLGKRGRRNRAKDTAYECGKPPMGGPSPRFSVKFHLVAMLFILFDIEVVFLYPLAVAYRDLLGNPGARPLAFFGTLTFLGILGVGVLYEVKKRALDWRS